MGKAGESDITEGASGRQAKPGFRQLLSSRHSASATHLLDKGQGVVALNHAEGFARVEGAGKQTLPAARRAGVAAPFSSSRPPHAKQGDVWLEVCVVAEQGHAAAEVEWPHKVDDCLSAGGEGKRGKGGIKVAGGEAPESLI